jgi:exonuclease VII large subunit
MQQCTSMLREKMWNDTHSRPPPPAMRYRAGDNGSGKPDNALEAMGPVLESVLGSLTQEYERRLMLKDQEIKQAKEQLQRAQEQAAALEQQLASGGQRAQIEYQMTEEMKAEMENMRNQEVALIQKVQLFLCLLHSPYFVKEQSDRLWP